MVFKDRPTIGLFTKELPRLYFFPLLKGIRNACSMFKINLRIFMSSLFDNSSTIDEYAFFDLVCKENVDAVIFLSIPVPLFVNKDELARFASRFSALPLVNLGMPLENIPSIIIENQKGIYEVTSHLIEHHGYRNIAHLSGPMANWEAELRFEGYKQALADHDIPFNRDLYFEGNFTFETGLTACREFFENRKVKPDAIVAANDDMAMGIYHYCQQKGIKIPGDLGITGFDNLLNSSFSMPPLTTVAQPLYRTGKEAVKLAYDQIENRDVPEVTVLPTTPLVRRSCGCSYVEEINFGISKVPTVSVSMNTCCYDRILKIRETVTTGILNIALVEKVRNVKYLSDYIVAMICGEECLSRQGGTGYHKRLIGHSKDGTIEKFIFSSYLTVYELNSWLDFMADFYSRIKNMPDFEPMAETVQSVFSTLVYHINQAIRFKMGTIEAVMLENTHHYRRSMSRLNLSFILPEFLDILTGELVNHEFDFFYLCLWGGDKTGYASHEKLPESLRLMAGFDGKEKIDGCSKPVVFDRKELIPRDYFRSGKNHHFVVFPLVQHDYNFGFLILSYQIDKLDYYYPLWAQVCVSLNLIRLFDEAEKKQQVLNELNINLESKVAERTEELVAANEKLKEIDRLKTNFFANISHELRTPLTLILGPVEGIYAGDYGEVINRKDSVFKSVINNGSRLLKLINSLLDYSKIEAGKMQVVKKKIDIYQLLHYYLSIIQSAGMRRGIDVRLESQAGGVTAWIDRDLLEKALFNLFSNGLKFTPRGGAITIELDSDDNTFSISVKDTGIGIPREKVDAIFERFTQVDEGASRKYEGTGIGLAFTREIIGLHDGTIEVESEYGKGTVFTITLPFGSEKEASQKPRDHFDDEDEYEVKEYLISDFEKELLTGPDVEDKAAWQQEDLAHQKEPDTRKTILVVDDNQQMRTFLTSILNRFYSVVTAKNGREGLEKAAHHIPDLILSDVMMPVMDGIEFCHQLKRTGNLKHIPLILLTARTDISLKMDGLNEMADDFLPKPFNSRELMIRVKNLLKNRELHAEMARQQLTIMSSVGYARKIQNSVLPGPDEMKMLMKDFFILWKPKDIVGGDIYWYKQLGDNFIVAVIDCTGHGIPGAFMSMIVQTELSSIVKLINNNNPGVILWELNNSIKTTLKQENTPGPTELKAVSDDGLDICLCYYNSEKQTLTYAGARRPLYYVHNNQLIEVEADKMSIGYRSSGFNHTFTNHEIKLTGHEVFYLTTDGYTDQMGGPGGFCYGSAELKKLLLSIHKENMNKQRTILKKKLKEYQRGWKQVDDITILGFITRNHNTESH